MSSETYIQINIQFRKYLLIINKLLLTLSSK